MGMVAPRQQIASAFVVLCGKYGDVTRLARERGICRQWVYRQAAQTVTLLELQPWREEIARLQQRVRELEQETASLKEQLARSVVLDEATQAEFACVAQAVGVSLPACRELLEVLIPGRALSVASLGRHTHTAGEKAGKLLEVLDEPARERTRQTAADEIYVRDPVLMVVEQDSLCWLSGRLSEDVSGETWAKEFRQLPNLEQVTRDGGKGLEKGVALVNEERRQKGQPPIVDQGDHFHAFWGGGIGLARAERRSAKTLAEAEVAQKALDDCLRQGQDARGAAQRVKVAWRRAEQAMDAWCELERLWRRTKEALQLVTPEGECNTREKATAVLAEVLPQLPDDDFAKVKRQLQKPEMLAYLDRVQKQVEALPLPDEVKRAAVRQECLRRRPELLQGEGKRAAALRGVLLACAVALSQSGETGRQAAEAVRGIFRKAYRASSLVECINSVLRMQQARHRKMTQGLLDLKRLYWNCHTFRTGRRRGTSPYQRLGLPWPEGLRWWDMLKWTPEQLRDKLSTVKQAA